MRLVIFYFYICIVHATHAHLICYSFISTHCNTKEPRVSIITAEKLQVRDHTYHSLLELKVPPPTSDPPFCGLSTSNLGEQKISWCWIQPNPKTCCFKSQKKFPFTFGLKILEFKKGSWDPIYSLNYPQWSLAHGRWKTPAVDSSGGKEYIGRETPIRWVTNITLLIQKVFMSDQNFATAL